MWLERREVGHDGAMVAPDDGHDLHPVDLEPADQDMVDAKEPGRARPWPPSRPRSMAVACGRLDCGIGHEANEAPVDGPCRCRIEVADHEPPATRYCSEVLGDAPHLSSTAGERPPDWWHLRRDHVNVYDFDDIVVAAWSVERHLGQETVAPRQRETPDPSGMPKQDTHARVISSWPERAKGQRPTKKVCLLRAKLLHGDNIRLDRLYQLTESLRASAPVEEISRHDPESWCVRCHGAIHVPNQSRQVKRGRIRLRRTGSPCAGPRPLPFTVQTTRNSPLGETVVITDLATS